MRLLVQKLNTVKGLAEDKTLEPEHEPAAIEQDGAGSTCRRVVFILVALTDNDNGFNLQSREKICLL
jgi:hypothetical protein